MKINDLFKNTNGEVAKIVEVDEVRKTCLIEMTDGKTKSLSFSTLNDKRRWIPAEEDDQYVAEVMQQKKDLNIECPKIESYEEMSDEEWEKSARSVQIEEDELVPMPGAEKLADLKKSSKRNLIEYNGKALTLHGWSKELGVPFGTLYARVTRFNWTYEEALSGVKNK